MDLSFSDLRQDYPEKALVRKTLPEDPAELALEWVQEAIHCAPPEIEANAMHLATANMQGRPSCRVVLLKNLEQGAFYFFTDYRSKKACDLAENPHAALCFYWPWMCRQLRVEGEVSKLSPQESASYFSSRPQESQVAACVSNQSSALESREALEEAFKEKFQQLEGQTIQCPKHWGGYQLTPSRYEFWQGQKHRLHDRICYTLDSSSGWEVCRLYP